MLSARACSDAATLPACHILNGTFTAEQQAIGTARTNLAEAAFLRDVVEAAKAPGLTARHRVRGLLAA